MICPKCNKKIEDGSIFCTECGSKIEVKEEVFYCEECGNKLKKGSAFCTECGTKVGTKVKEEKKEIKKDIIKCVKCGAELAKDSAFCTECGTKVGIEETKEKKEEVKETKKTSTKKKTEEFKCPGCGAELAKDSTFCTECGTKVENKTIKKEETKSEKKDSGHTATLTVTRKKTIKGCAIPFHVLVDGVQIGDLKNGQSITYELTEGIHKVTISTIDKDTDQPVEVTKDRNSIEILTIAKMGLVAAKADIVDIIFN